MEFIEDLKDSFDSVDPTKQTQPKNTQPLDPSIYSAYVKNPSDITEDVLYQLSDIISGRMNIRADKQKPGVPTTPDVVDRLLNSVTIVYIEEERIPVGVASLVDPTQKNYMGFKPIDIYSMHSGVNLEGRVLMEFFAVPDEYINKGIGEELLAQIDATGTKVFTVTDNDDENENELLTAFGFKPVANMDIDTNEVPVTLWLK